MGASMGSFAARKNAGLYSTAFNQHLDANGATREEIKSINDTIFDLIDKTRDKKEEFLSTDANRNRFMTGNEMITQLKRVEIKFLEFIKSRQYFAFFEEG